MIKKPYTKCMRVGEGLLVAAGSVSITGLSAGSHQCWDVQKGMAGAGLEVRDALLVPLARGCSWLWLGSIVFPSRDVG